MGDLGGLTTYRVKVSPKSSSIASSPSTPNAPKKNVTDTYAGSVPNTKHPTKSAPKPSSKVLVKARKLRSPLPKSKPSLNNPKINSPPFATCSAPATTLGRSPKSPHSLKTVVDIKTQFPKISNALNGSAFYSAIKTDKSNTGNISKPNKQVEKRSPSIPFKKATLYTQVGLTPFNSPLQRGKTRNLVPSPLQGEG